MAVASRDHDLSLLAAANNHGGLAVKLSSLKQVKDILSSVDPSLAAELFPYLVELQSSPETLVRRALVETIEDVGLKAMEHSYILVPVLLAFLRDGDSSVASQSIITGTNFFYRFLEAMALQFHWHDRVERWLEEFWTWMVRFKDTAFFHCIGVWFGWSKVTGTQILETYVLLFTSDTSDSEKFTTEATIGSRQAFNISRLVGGHPFLDPVKLMSEANRTLGTLFLLQSARSLPGPVTITVVSCLAAIARKRPHRYNTILSALVDFNPNFETVKGCHGASIQYSFKDRLFRISPVYSFDHYRV